MVAEIRDRAREWINKMVPPGTEIRSNGQTAAQFTQITGLDQATLEKFWKAHEGIYPPGARPVLTSCNAFVGHYCGGIGLPTTLGVFPLQKKLRQLNKEEAWIVSAPDRTPKMGDICRWAGRLHVGVCLSWDYDSATDTHTWHTAEVGQGGPLYDKTGAYKGGYDIVRQNTYPDLKGRPRRGPYSSSLLEGWVDIELFVGSSEEDPYAEATLDPWLNENGQVVYPDAPAGGGGPGAFRPAGPLCFYPYAEGLPHPDSPAARTLDPLEIDQFTEDRNKA